MTKCSHIYFSLKIPGPTFEMHRQVEVSNNKHKTINDFKIVILFVSTNSPCSILSLNFLSSAFTRFYFLFDVGSYLKYFKTVFGKESFGTSLKYVEEFEGRLEDDLCISKFSHDGQSKYAALKQAVEVLMNYMTFICRSAPPIQHCCVTVLEIWREKRMVSLFITLHK